MNCLQILEGWSQASRLRSLVFLVQVAYGVLDPLLLGFCTDLLARDGLEDHCFFRTLAAGDSSVAHQPLHRDLLTGKCIAAGDWRINCIWRQDQKEKAF